MQQRGIALDDDAREALSSGSAAAQRAALFDTLFGELVEPTLVQPTFVLDIPLELSPLARAQHDEPALADRFEFYVNGMELANAYGELADPREQAQRFDEQQQQQQQQTGARVNNGNLKDERFLDALRYGLPPTSGYGIGIDRLVVRMGGVVAVVLVSFKRAHTLCQMQLMSDDAQVQGIRDVILFPLLRTHTSTLAETDTDAP